jgi:hypothetical protein
MAMACGEKIPRPRRARPPTLPMISSRRPSTAPMFSPVPNGAAAAPAAQARITRHHPARGARCRRRGIYTSDGDIPAVTGRCKPLEEEISGEGGEGGSPSFPAHLWWRRPAEEVDLREALLLRPLLPLLSTTPRRKHAARGRARRSTGGGVRAASAWPAPPLARAGPGRATVAAAAAGAPSSQRRPSPPGWRGDACLGGCAVGAAPPLISPVAAARGAGG